MDESLAEIERLSGRHLLFLDDSIFGDTRHAVFRPARMTAEVLEVGYWRA